MTSVRAVQVDQGIAWIVLASNFVNGLVATGAVMQCGVYIAAMIAEFHCSRAEGYIVGAVIVGLFFGVGPVASLLVEKTSLRAVAMGGSILAASGFIISANVPSLHYMYATFTITALGCGCMYQTSVIAPFYYFDKYRSFASGLTAAGAGIGMMLYPLFCQLIIAKYTWQPSLYIVAGVFLNTCVGSMMIRPFTVPHEPTLTEKSHVVLVPDTLEGGLLLSKEVSKDECTCDVSNKNCDFSLAGNLLPTQSAIKIEIIASRIQNYPCLWHNQSFWLLLISYLLYTAAVCSACIVMPDMYEMGGMGQRQQSILYLAWGAGNVIGRLSTCLWLKFLSSLTFVCAANYVWATSLLLYTYHTNYVCLLLANVVTSLAYGAFAGCIYIATYDIVGLKLSNRALGYGNFFAGVGGVLVPPLLGKIYDATLDYTWPIVVAAMLSMISATLLLAILVSRRKHTQQELK